MDVNNNSFDHPLMETPIKVKGVKGESRDDDAFKEWVEGNVSSQATNQNKQLTYKKCKQTFLEGKCWANPQCPLGKSPARNVPRRFLLFLKYGGRRRRFFPRSKRVGYFSVHLNMFFLHNITNSNLVVDGARVDLVLVSDSLGNFSS